MEAEARGIQEAINWLEDLCLVGINIECDSELAVKAVNGKVEYYLEVGHIIEFCKQKLRQRPHLTLSCKKSKQTVLLTFWLDCRV